MIRRHFFLFAALTVLALMLAVGGLKLAASAASHGPGGAGRGRGGNSSGVAVAQTLPVSKPFDDTIEVLGVAKGRQSLTVTSNTTELITAVHFHDGEHVGKGQVLVELKAQEESAGIAQAQSALSLAELNFNRWKTLGAQGIASSASVDQYRVAYEQAQASLNAAKSRLGDRVIRAPFSGVVGLSDVTPGTLINPGGAVVSLDDVSVIRADFDVPDRYLAALHPGLQISARTDAFPNERVVGRIATLDTRVDQHTRAIKARAEFPNPSGRLKPGMLIRVSIDQGVRQSLAVPESAVQFEGDQASVFVLVHRKGELFAEQRPVEAGADQNGYIEIKSGLGSNEAVVADGVNRITPNQPVRLAAGGGRRGGGARSGK